MPILLDTHAALWSANGTLKPNLQRRVEAAGRERELLLSPISAWEIGMLVVKGRLSISCAVEDFVRSLYAENGVVTATLTPQIALAAARLPASFPGDPADRFIVATAMNFRAELFTRDARILHFGKSSAMLRCVVC